MNIPRPRTVILPSASPHSDGTTSSRTMSAPGQKRTFNGSSRMSGYGGKADIGGAWRGASLGAPSSAGVSYALSASLASALNVFMAALSVKMPVTCWREFGVPFLPPCFSTSLRTVPRRFSVAA